MIKKIVVVGNGLDLHHGIKSRYSDFYSSPLFPKQLKCIYTIMTEGYREKSTWYDFEEEYRHLIFTENKIIENGGYISGNVGLSEKNKKYYLPRVKLINYIFQEIKIQFTSYLLEEYEVAKKREGFVRDSVISQELENADKILNFNYTDTLADIYKIDAGKVVHVHGTLKDDPVLGHSNFCDYEDNVNYGLRVNMPDMRTSAYLGDKNLQRIEAWNGMHVNENYSGASYIGAGGLTIKEVKNNSFISMNTLNANYSNPFEELVDSSNGYKYSNRLAMKFSDDLEIVIIGHGLQSDRDLLSKINVENKRVICMVRKNKDCEIAKRAQNLFGVSKAITNNYEWE